MNRSLHNHIVDSQIDMLTEGQICPICDRPFRTRSEKDNAICVAKHPLRFAHEQCSHTELIADLKLFQAKASCIHSQRRANQLWRELRPRLTQYEQRQISIAWCLDLIGGGRGELDEICRKIIALKIEIAGNA